jgi:Flp pilus assembly pilin Flp
MGQAVTCLWKDEDALTTVEYALLIALMVVVAAASWARLGETLSNSADEPIAAMEPQQRADG